MVAALLADKFVNTGTDGPSSVAPERVVVSSTPPNRLPYKVTSKDESLANAKATKYDSVDYENLKVTVFGNTAIATGDFKAKGTDHSGKPMDLHERFTDTWVKMRDGHWQCVASHGSPVTM